MNRYSEPREYNDTAGSLQRGAWPVGERTRVALLRAGCGGSSLSFLCLVQRWILQPRNASLQTPLCTSPFQPRTSCSSQPWRGTTLANCPHTWPSGPRHQSPSERPPLGSAAPERGSHLPSSPSLPHPGQCPPPGPWEPAVSLPLLVTRHIQAE